MSLKVISPVTGEVYVTRAYPTLQEIDTALGSAKSSFSSWKARPVDERVSIVRKALELIGEKKMLLAEELTFQMGRQVVRRLFLHDMA